MRPNLRLGAIVASAGLLAASLTPAPTTASPAEIAAKQTVKTNFALFSTGVGSVASGGQVPAGSDGTAFTMIGCTVRAGVTKTNFVEETTVPGLGTLSGVRTRLWTEKKGNVVSSYATHRVAEVVIDDNPMGTVTIEGVRSLSRAYHDGTRFRTDSETQVAKIVLSPATGPDQILEVPSPGRPLLVPGIARIAIPSTISKPITDGIRVATDAIDIKVIGTNTRTRIAHTAARIQKGAPFGTFRGESAGVRARALDDNVKVGLTPLTIMPCKGTKGQVTDKSLAQVKLGDQGVVRGLDSEQMGLQRPGFATSYEQGHVAKVNFGNGQLVIDGITGKANVTRTGTTLKRDTKGTTIGSIVANGRTYSFPPSGVLQIPGIAKLEEEVVHHISNGISVIALRVTLLDGTGAVIDLGIAEASIRKG